MLRLGALVQDASQHDSGLAGSLIQNGTFSHFASSKDGHKDHLGEFALYSELILSGEAYERYLPDILLWDPWDT